MALDGNVDGHVSVRGPLFHDGDDVRDPFSRDGGQYVNDRSGLRDCGHHENGRDCGRGCGRGRDEHGQKRSCRPS